MDNDKIAALKALIGEDNVASILEQIKATQKEAEALGTAYKEASSVEEPFLKPMTPDDVARIVTTGGTLAISTGETVTGSAANWGSIAVTKDDIAVAASDDASFAEEPVYAGDLLPNELATLVANSVASALAPYLKTVRDEMVAEVKAHAGSAVKSDDIALLQEQQARQALQEQQARAQLQATIDTLAAQHQETTKALKAAQEQLAELTGEQPRMLKREQPGFRASQAESTVIGDSHALKARQPVGIDPNFFDFAINGKTNQQLPPQ